MNVFEELVCTTEHYTHLVILGVSTFGTVCNGVLYGVNPMGGRIIGFVFLRLFGVV